MTYQIELVWIKVFLVDIKMLSTTFIERIISLYITINIFLFSKYYNRLTKDIIERKMLIQLIKVTQASPVIKYFDQIFRGVFRERVLQIHIIFFAVITSS